MIATLFFLNLASAIAIGTLDGLFLAGTLQEDAKFINLRSIVYLLINFLWWTDTYLIFVALIRIKTYAL